MMEQQSTCSRKQKKHIELLKASLVLQRTVESRVDVGGGAVSVFNHEIKELVKGVMRKFHQFPNADHE